jgi:hypothetical protein
MDIGPRHDRLIVRRLEEGEQKIGGIIIRDTAKEKPQQGTVLPVGKGKIFDGWPSSGGGGAKGARERRARDGREHSYSDGP